MLYYPFNLRNNKTSIKKKFLCYIIIIIYKEIKIIKSKLKMHFNINPYVKAIDSKNIKKIENLINFNENSINKSRCCS